jgi:hypothetical protein
MTRPKIAIPAFYLLVICAGWTTEPTDWIAEKHTAYNLHYTSADKDNTKEYLAYIDAGIKSVTRFFEDTFKLKFDVYIHPDRLSIDSQWRKDWNMPGFKSECWMVASGIGYKLDMISPKTWDTEACEHSYNDKTGIQGVITHELIHVFHGQLNKSHDFSDVSGIDWFVEGVATYASGQCDAGKLAEIKNALSENKIQLSLESFWTGKLRYGLSGSMVMYIDSRFGRDKLKGLLKFSRKEEILESLKITEGDLLNGWESYIKNMEIS